MVIIDDIGSFPLPAEIKREEFNRIYKEVQQGVAEGKDVEEFPLFYQTVKQSLWKKISSGIDVVTYPQHYDMHRQFLEPIMSYPEEPFVISNKQAVIPEVIVAEREAKLYYEEKGEPLRLRVCVTGAVELYLKTEFGFNVYPEVLMNIAESVRRFLKNATIKKKHIVTEVVSIDEPSLGFVDLYNVEKGDIAKALDRSVSGVEADVQIHLHTLKSAEYALMSDNIQILTGEFASSPKNMDFISKKELESHDKFLRAGVVATNIDAKLGKLVQQGIKNPEPEMLVDTEEQIAGIYKKLREKFGDRITHAGPDCGLGSWPSQEAAELVLRRAVKVIREQAI